MIKIMHFYWLMWLIMCYGIGFSLMFNVNGQCWSERMIEKCSVCDLVSHKIIFVILLFIGVSLLLTLQLPKSMVKKFSKKLSRGSYSRFLHIKFLPCCRRWNKFSKLARISVSTKHEHHEGLQQIQISQKHQHSKQKDYVWQFQ